MTGTFSIGAVAKITGLTVHNIRAWERRHSAISAERTSTGRRIYDQADLDRLLLLKQNINAGRSISMIAGLSNEDLRDFLLSQTSAMASNQFGKGSQLAIGVFGNFPRFADDLAAAGFDDISQWAHQLEFEQTAGNKKLDLLIGDIPSIGQQSAAKLKVLLELHRIEKAIVIYRYASEPLLKSFDGMPVELVRAPIHRQELLDLTKQLAGDRQSNANNQNGDLHYPKKLFTTEEIQLAANISNNIDCDCPGHLAEIITNLNAFEHYSSLCSNTNSNGAQLHKEIQHATALSRHKMELVLQKVLEVEKIDLKKLVEH